MVLRGSRSLDGRIQKGSRSKGRFYHSMTHELLKKLPPQPSRPRSFAPHRSTPRPRTPAPHVRRQNPSTSFSTFSYKHSYHPSQHMAISHQKSISNTTFNYSDSKSNSENGFAGITDLLIADPESSRSPPAQEPHPTLHIRQTTGLSQLLKCHLMII